MSSERRVDAKGRITIPREIRERLGIDPGEQVTIGVEDGEIVVRRRVDREDAVEALEGCVDAETRRSGAEPTDPRDLKDDWTSDLP